MKSNFIKILGTVAVINIVARLLGFAREVIIGYQYGTSYSADSIITAFTIPNFIYIVVGGAVTTALISVYTKIESSRKNMFVQAIFTGLGILMAIVVVVFMVFPQFWINLFFGGMGAEAMQLTSRLFRIMAPATLFLSLAMLLSGLHNVYENFRLTSFSTLMFNAVFLVIGAGLTPFMLEYSYGLGASVGALVMLAILIIQARKQQLMPVKPKWTNMPEITRFIKFALPIIFGGATIQFYFIIQRIFASQLEAGLISALNYASKMTQFPQAVLMTSVTTVIYPLLSKAIAEVDLNKFSNAYKKGFRMLTLILLPATAFLYFYAEDIISFIFEYGNFDASSTGRTYPLLQILSLSVFGLALNAYVTRFFYAKENSYLPIIMNVISVFGVNILVIMLLIDHMGAAAIALGTVVATLVNMLLLIVAAKIKLNLSVSSWGYLLRMILFVSFASIVIWLSTFVPIAITFVSLAIGGLITGGLVLGGLKVVK